MSPEVIAAVIAAGASVLTLIGTLAAQYFGGRAASKDAEKSLAEQREQLSKTFAEQREQLTNTLQAQSEQLDRTLAEQSKQLDRTLAEQRTRTLNERFTTAAEQLGSDKPAVRLAGVYAMAGLADDWEENRQTCVDVLCAYLRMPYEPDPGQGAPEPQRLAFKAIREVRHTVIRVITAHLKKDAAVSWQCLNFDFTGVVFDGGDFMEAQFSGGIVSFSYAQFSGGRVSFSSARFSGGHVSFIGAQFSGGAVDFSRAQFSGGTVYFVIMEFSGGHVNFDGARFSGGHVLFTGSKFSGGAVTFDGGRFSGGRVSFSLAALSGSTIDFSNAADWSSPPEFPWTDTPPSGVKLPKKEEQSQT
jgi:hypothetical protein